MTRKVLEPDRGFVWSIIRQSNSGGWMDKCSKDFGRVRSSTVEKPSPERTVDRF
jgi:hypothetical protein